MPRTAIIVQARFASTRLPGKVLMNLAGHTVLWHVLRRCQMVPGVDVVCCATTDRADCDPVAAEAERCGAFVFRGSEQDVLGRYFQAAREFGAKVVLRVTSDCPLIDPGICGHVLRLITKDGADYACNNMPPSWPHGLDCEAFTFDVLERAAQEALELYEREHVTPWLRAHPRLSKANFPGPGGWVSKQRWTLDFPEDLEFFQKLFAELPSEKGITDTNKIIDLLRNRPDIVQLNSHHRDTSRPKMPSVIEGK